jgi:hypothetical protein
MDHITCSLSTTEEDQYIPLSISKDSDEEFANAVKSVTKTVSSRSFGGYEVWPYGTSHSVSPFKKYQAGAKSGMEKLGNAFNSMAKDPKSLATHTAREVSSDAKNLSEAILGECDQYYYNETSFIGLPPSSELSGRLRTAGVRSKLEFDIGSRTCRFFLVFMIKAELNLLYAGAEIVLTLVVIIACKFSKTSFPVSFTQGLVLTDVWYNSTPSNVLWTDHICRSRWKYRPHDVFESCSPLVRLLQIQYVR